jgi:hypothetical protein
MVGPVPSATSAFVTLAVSTDLARNPGSATATKDGEDSSAIRFEFDAVTLGQMSFWQMTKVQKLLETQAAVI